MARPTGWLLKLLTWNARGDTIICVISGLLVSFELTVSAKRKYATVILVFFRYLFSFSLSFSLSLSFYLYLFLPPGIMAIECAEMQPPFYEMHPMSMLRHMTKSSFRPPGLKQKNKWYEPVGWEWACQYYIGGSLDISRTSI